MKPQISAINAVALTTLTFVTASGLPTNNHNLSFALVWLLFMVLTALPLAFIEAVLVRRSRALPLQGLAAITRDSDAPTFWRVLAPLSMLTLVGMIAFGVENSTHGLAVNDDTAIAVRAFPYLFVFLAMGFAWVGMKRLLPFVGVLVPAVLLLNALLAAHTGLLVLLTPEEWQQVATAALLANMSTLGLYAWLILTRLTDERATQTVMPLWLTQTLVGVVTIAAGSAQGNLSVILYMLTAVFACALLAEVVTQQLQAKQFTKPIAVGSVMLVAAATTALTEYVAFDVVLKALALVTMLGFSLLLGWVIKTSHARKALNFSSEGMYNLWRVGVRIVAPVTILWLLVTMVIRVG